MFVMYPCDECWDRNCPLLARQAVYGRGEHGTIVVNGSSEGSRSGEPALVGLHHFNRELITVLDSLRQATCRTHVARPLRRNLFGSKIGRKNFARVRMKTLMHEGFFTSFCCSKRDLQWATY